MKAEIAVLRFSSRHRTATELEQMIIAQVRASMACPAALKVRVLRVDGRWDVFPGPIDKEAYPDCLPLMLEIANQLREAYDLVE